MGIILPTDEVIFFRGVGSNHQFMYLSYIPIETSTARSGISSPRKTGMTLISQDEILRHCDVANDGE